MAKRPSRLCPVSKELLFASAIAVLLLSACNNTTRTARLDPAVLGSKQFYDSALLKLEKEDTRQVAHLVSNPSRRHYSFEATHKEEYTTRGSLVSSARPQSQNVVSYKGGAQISDSLHLNLEGSFTETQRSREKGARTLLINERLGWEQNAVSDNKISLGVLDNRLRLTSRQAVSNFTFEKGGVRKREEGKALAQRLDADLWKGNDTTLAMFMEHSVVDDAFYAIGLSRRPQSFSRHNRRADRVGGAVGLGPMNVRLSRNFYERGTISNRRKEETYEALVMLSLSDLRWYTGDLSGSDFWQVVPSTIWVSIEPGVARPRSGTGGQDATQTLSFGMSWYWTGAYGTLGYWQYSYDSRQMGAEDHDWIGKGAFASFGTYGKTWNIDLSGSVNNGENKETYSRSADLGYDATLSVSYKPNALPDLSLGLTYGRYMTDYIAYDGRSLTALSELSAALDFTKFWRLHRGNADSSLKVIYWFRQLDTRDDFVGQRGAGDHVIGIRHRKRW